MNEHQTNIDFIFKNHTFEEKKVKTSTFGSKANHWVISATDRNDLAQLTKALKATSFNEGFDKGHFIVRGRDVIFNDSGTYKIRKIQKKHEVESNPRWLEYDQLTDERINSQFMPHNSNVIIYPINGYTAIDYKNRDALFQPSVDASLQERPEKQTIAKFHISLARADIPKAWNAIAHYLVDHEILCKVVSPQGLEAKGNKEDKPIVLYVTREGIKDVNGWHKVLTDIESILVANDVKAGDAIKSDRPIEGSRFLHFRYGNTVYESNGATTKWDDDMGVLNGGVDSFADLRINVTEEQAKRFQHELAANTGKGNHKNHLQH